MLPNRELRDLVYTILPIISIMSVVLYDYLMIKQKKAIASKGALFIHHKAIEGVHKHKILKPFTSLTFLMCIEIFVFCLFHYLPVSFVNPTFGELLETGGNYFATIYFLPVFMIIGTLLIWANPLKTIDLVTPSLPLALSIVKIGCYAAGCCNGVWWLGGPYNYVNEREEFPVQLVESATAFLIFIFLLWYKKRAKSGTMFPLYTILYSGTRFISEFWRGQELILGNLRLYHILCIIGLVLGFIELFVVLKYGDKIERFFENTFYFSRERYKKYFKKER